MRATSNAASPRLDPETIRAFALALNRAERTGVQIPLISHDDPAMTMDEAYAIQAEWVAIKRSSGDESVGWKIGLTSKAMQSALSIDIPDSGVLLRSMVFPNGARIPARRFIQPRVEAEIAFITKAPIEAGDCSAEAILAATDYIAPAIEILDTRIMRKDPRSNVMRNVIDTISDNAANAGIVLGDPVRSFQSLDLRWLGAILMRNGEVEETGLGAGVLNDPLISVGWLAQRLARYGERIEAGQIVLSGSFIRPVEAQYPCHIVGDFGPLGRVECRFG